MSRRHRFRIAQLPVSAVPAGTAAGASGVTGVGRSTRVGSGTAAGVATVSGIAPSGGSLLFNGKFTGTFPAYTGWTTNPSGQAGFNTHWTLTQLAGQAPSGLDAVRIQAITFDTGNTDQTSAWWSKSNPIGGEITQGALWVVRFRFRLNGAQLWAKAQDGSNTNTKVVIIGDGGVSGNRMMTHMDSAAAPDRIWVYVARNIIVESPAVEVTEDVWHSVQMWVQSASSAGATDGEVRLYYDNDTFASPSATTGATLAPTADWDQTLRFGAGTQWTLNHSSNYSVDFADFELDDAFDSSWWANT